LRASTKVSISMARSVLSGMASTSSSVTTTYLPFDHS